MSMTVNQFLSTTTPTNSSLYMAIDSAYNDLKTCAKAAQAHNCLEEAQFYRIIIESLNMESIYYAKDVFKRFGSFDIKNKDKEYRILVTRHPAKWYGKVIGTSKYVEAETLRDLLKSARESVDDDNINDNFENFINETLDSIKTHVSHTRDYNEFVLHFTA